MEMKSIIVVLGIIIVVSGAILGYYYLNMNHENGSTPIVNNNISSEDINILFLHHSTGSNIWNGGVKEWFESYNISYSTNYSIFEQDFPKSSPYGWNNYPFDYWNIWVNHAGSEPYKEEPTLEILTEIYDVIIWKHCFPVSDIVTDSGDPSIDSDEKCIENYKLHYNALKAKMKEFSDTNFIVWTISSLVASSTTEEKAVRAKEFYHWVKDEWDDKGDNIYLWDFYILETEGDLYVQNDYSVNPSDSHPNHEFSMMVAPYLCQRIIDVIDGEGDDMDITGKSITVII
jgi:hypothetical protein